MIVANTHVAELPTVEAVAYFDIWCTQLLPVPNNLSYWKLDEYKGNVGTNRHLRRIYRRMPAYQQMPQRLADAIAMEAEDASKWFFDPSFGIYMAVSTREIVTTEDVHRRIQGFQYGMDREVARLHGFEFTGGWAWRFDNSWRETYEKWVISYKLNHEPVCEHEKNARLDLTELPFHIQRALVTRWQRLWEYYDSNPEAWA